MKAKACPLSGGIRLLRRGTSARPAYGEDPVTPPDSYLTVVRNSTGKHMVMLQAIWCLHGLLDEHCG